MAKKILFRCSGGLGKQIMATAVAKQIKEKFNDCVLHVQTSYPEVFANLPFVDRYYPLQPIPYFYNDHNEFDILNTELYEDLKYRQNKEHAIITWCRKLGLDKPKKVSGIIQLDNNELSTGNQFIMNTKLDTDKLIAFQPFGGTSYYQPNEAQNPMRVKQARDLPVETAQKVVDILIDKGYQVIHIGLPTEPILQNAVRLSDKDVVNPRYVLSILNKCKYGLFIDSFAQHAWKALGKENAVVMWGATHFKSLGYESNINIELTGKCNSLHCNRPNTHVGDFTGNNNIWKCLFNNKCMDFEAESLVDKIIQLDKDNQIPNDNPTEIPMEK